MKSAIFVLLTLLNVNAIAQVHHTMIWGTVYNIFHEEYSTDQEFFQQVDKDISAIKAANLNQIMIFPMSQWDSETKELRWVRTDFLIKKIEQEGLRFVPILLKEEQCSYYFPIWKFKEIPGFWEKYNLNNDGRNNRDNVDFADPRVYPLLESYLKAVISRYGKSPALSFYNLWNEPHYHSGSDQTVGEFRQWLERKYGSLQTLNRIWGNEYHAWDEVSPFLNENWKSSMPQIDWTLFCNELDGVLLGKLKSSLRVYDPVHQVNANPVGTSWADFGVFGSYATDNWVFTRDNDINGVSYYPDAWERAHNLTPYPGWLHNLALNTIRSASGSKDFILTEMYTNTQNGFALNGYLEKNSIASVAWTAFANDCKGILFWKWEPFRRGRQSLGRGLTTLDGKLAPRGEAVKEIGRVLKQHGDVLLKARLDTPRVAILMDMVGLLKTLEQTVEPSTTTFMYESNAGIFKALFEENISVDLLRMDLGVSLEKLKQYKIVFLPFQIVIRREFADVLKDYVRQGGYVVADARIASIDEFDFAYSKSPGAGLDDLFGATRRDWIGKKGTFPVTMKSANDSAIYSVEGKYFRDDLVPGNQDDVIGRFADDNAPAVLVHQYGRGKAVLAAIPLGGSYYGNPENRVRKAIVDFAHQAGVWPEARFISSGSSTPSIKIHFTANVKVIYALNYDATEQTGTMEITTGDFVPSTVINILSDRSVPFQCHDGRTNIGMSIPPHGVAVLIMTM